MLATVASASLLGVRGQPVVVEVHVSGGLPSFTIVGQPDGACREARDRVRAAVLSSGLDWPQSRITVNLAPSGVRKAGAGLDLAMALAVLVASRQVPPASVEDTAFVGELGLDGALRPVPGTLPLVAAAGRPRAVVPPAAHAEADLVPGVAARSTSRLDELVACLAGRAPWPPRPPSPSAPPSPSVDDLAHVRGQPLARRAVEVAAAGGHHLLLIGPPGAGKTMLARAVVGLLPPLGPDDALDVTTVHSAAGLPVSGALVERPPFRAPHHTASTVALVGGGSQALRPGEISCAHAGVLFLDELGEFPAAVLDALRQPLEEGVVRVARAYGATTLPARVLLVAAMNPCPCGGAMGASSCTCGDAARQRYLRRVSGPLLDRFDLRVHVDRPPAAALLAPSASASEESSEAVAARVVEARRVAAGRGLRDNAAIAGADLDRWAPLTDEARARLQRVVERGGLSGRGLHRIRRVARTIADLAGHEGPVGRDHVDEALLLRAEVLSAAPAGSRP